MKELVTVVIPIFEGALAGHQKLILQSYQNHLGDFQITFLKGESKYPLDEYLEICPKADHILFDDRYFTNRASVTKLLLSQELYEMFGWSRYLLIGNLHSAVVKNELAYWCRQGYDLIQPGPSHEINTNWADSIRKRLNPKEHIGKFAAETREYDRAGGFSLRKVDTMQKLVKRKKRAIYHFMNAFPAVSNDSVFWEYYTNRWSPELLTPQAIIRDRFAKIQSGAFDGEKPFALLGITNPTSL